MTEKYRKDRIDLLKAMHTIVGDFNHEGAYMRWINLVPDCPSEQDIADMAEDDEDMESAVKLFYALIAKYGKYGLVVQGDWNQHELMTFGATADCDEEDE